MVRPRPCGRIWSVRRASRRGKQSATLPRSLRPAIRPVSRTAIIAMTSWCARARQGPVECGPKVARDTRRPDRPPAPPVRRAVGRPCPGAAPPPLALRCAISPSRTVPAGRSKWAACVNRVERYGRAMPPCRLAPTPLSSPQTRVPSVLQFSQAVMTSTCMHAGRHRRTGRAAAGWRGPTALAQADYGHLPTDQVPRGPCVGQQATTCWMVQRFRRSSIT